MTETTQDANTNTQETRTFTQDDVDRIVAERLSREKAKFADYEALKEKAAKFDKSEEDQKSELQKATEKAAELEAKLAAREKADKVRAIREKVAKEKNVPADLLTGDTEDACTEQAKQLLSWKTPEGYPYVRDGGEANVQSGGGSAREKFAEWAKEQF